MVDTSQQLQISLKNAGQSLTKPRQTVFKALLQHDPQSMHDLILACSPEVDRASVYRTVSLFETLGIVQRIQTGWKSKLELSDAFQSHHHHATCVMCAAIIPLKENTIIEEQLQELLSNIGFEARDHQIEIRGICKACQKNKSI